MIKKNYLGILGYKGFVGSAIARYCKKNKIQFIGISRKKNYENESLRFKFLINCAMPSKRYWAKKFPKKDFEETVLKTDYFLRNFKYEKFIHLSSVSARVQLDTVYGRNKKKAENLVKKIKFFTIYRLASMYGRGLNKGVLIDLINSSKVYLNKNSNYSFTKVDKIAEFIILNLKNFKNKKVEIGCNDSLKLEDIKNKINSKSKFKGVIDNQILIKNKINIFFGSSKKVFRFLKSSKSKM
tara:strand:- start:1234 stop:1953 length:720 start_codon:yes stop_codon:yes gene_type:complete